MLLLIDIDEPLADLFDEDGDYQAIAADIAQLTFGVESAEVVTIDDKATYVGVVLKHRVTLDYVMPELTKTLERLRQSLQQASFQQAFVRS